ncbi:MAG: hypothetical protein H0V29_01250 [Thermoleophilaceae bacterium]|nr:hypothetical protein [Thermoleophilaceae bacterium]
MSKKLLTAAICLALPATAAASSTQPTILQDDARTVNSTPDVREAALNEMQTLGVDIVKITIEWNKLAPAGSAKPAGFDGTLPAAYDQAAWDRYSAAIDGAQARGMRPFISISGPAPQWASQRSNPPGVQRPNAAEFGRFAQAVGTKYPGVTMWSLWNEPNLPRFLLPQRVRKRPFSPHLYRTLLLAGEGGLRSSGHGSDTILFGELLPVGRASKGSRSSIRPIEFLREMACVDSKYKAYRGKAARSRGCSKFKKLPGTGLAYHPYTPAGGPGVNPPSEDDATIGQLSRITKALDRLKRRFKKSRMPLYLTEFGFQTDPPDRVQTPIKKAPGFMGESEYLAYKSSRVKTYSQYPLVDDFGSAGFQSGLKFASGAAKPGVLAEFQHPIFVRLLASNKVEVFGGSRNGEPRQVQVEAKVGRSDFKPLGGPITLSSSGYFRKSFRLSAAGARQFRFSFDGGTSRATKPSSRSSKHRR